MSVLPFVSVVVPVYNDSQRLGKCLVALAQQTYPRDRYELILVDNNSSENVRSVVDAFDGVVYAKESEEGPAVARNKGISLSKGEIIAFTDSDCLPYPDWLEKGVSALLRAGNNALVGGRIEFFFKNPSKPTTVELYDSVVYLQQKRCLQFSRFAVTANHFTYRSVFEKIGYFNGRLKSGEDYEWGRRHFKAGYPQRYADEVAVRHPARYSLVQARKKTVRLTGGIYDLQRAAGRWRWAWVAIWGFVPPLRQVARLWQDPRLSDVGQRIGVTGILLALRYVGAFEKLRLLFFGNSKGWR